jgi:hypothetical protein
MVLLAVPLAAPRSAVAQGSDPASAQVLFDEGRKAMARGDFAAACPQLAESHRLDPAIGTLLNLADCYEKSGKTASAWSRFLEAADVARASGQAPREKTARARAAALEPRLSRVKVDVPPASRIPGLSVSRDGVTVGEPLWGVPAPVDPGDHTVIARAAGKKDFSAKVVVSGEGTVVVVIPALEAGTSEAPPVAPVAPPVASTAAPRPVPPPTAPPPAEPPPSGGGWQKPTGLALTGVGAVGLVLGTVFGLRAKSKNDDSLAQCRSNDATACTQEGKNLRDSAHSAATLSTVSFGVGVAAVAGGLALYFTAPSPGSSTAAVRVGPGNVSLEGSF